MNGKVINAFGRKEGDPLPDESGIVKLTVCEQSLALLKDILDQVEKGIITNIGFVALHGGAPISYLANSNALVPELSMLNLAVDNLKDQIRDRAADFQEMISVDAKEEDGDD